MCVIISTEEAVRVSGGVREEEAEGGGKESEGTDESGPELKSSSDTGNLCRIHNMFVNLYYFVCIILIR